MFKKKDIITDEARIDEILDRGVVVEILPRKEDFKKLLLSGKQLHFYWGADPTGPSLHLSHAKNYQLLEEFRKLGHKVTVLFGDFTARIGDPTDKKTSARRRKTKEEINKNVKNWKKLISPIMDFGDKKNPPQIAMNGKWLSKLTFEDVVEIASNFTVQQMIERDMFERRINEQKPIYLHEFFYPLMQGYDSVALDVDVEGCGTDQIFNALAGRTLLKKYKDKEKFVMAVNLMENPKTKALMSKSTGLGVFLDTTSEDMYGQLMSQADEMTELFYINNTRLPLSDLDRLRKLNPKDFKMIVAHEIVKTFHGEKEANKAQDHFVSIFSKKEVSTDIPEIEVKKGESLMNLVCEQKMVSSKSDFRRLIDSGAVSVFDGKKIKDPKYKLEKEEVIRVGKKNIFKVKIK